MLETMYVHLPQKRAMYAIDPVQRLRLLEYRLEQADPKRLPRAAEFHAEMTDIFTSLRDLHTNYLLPEPFANRVAFLPFLIEEYRDRGRHRHIVSHIAPSAKIDDPTFETQVEVTHWNGVPIQRAVEVLARAQAGANAYACHDLALAALTIRPLIRLPVPDEEWVTITYRDRRRREQTIRVDWRIAEIDNDPEVMAMLRANDNALALGYDIEVDQIQKTRKALLFPEVVRSEQAIARGALEMADPGNGLDTGLPGVFRARTQATSVGEIGHLRIFTFMVSNADAFVGELARLLRLMPERGLILDVRGNGGGNILASERSLQLLTGTRPIVPERWQFINSPDTLALAQRYIDLAVWLPSIRQSVELGTLHSLAFEITSPTSSNALERAYAGPIVLITDATCYSATDIFTAGFQDHEIGPILGTSHATGAGGANVWTHDDLQALLPPSGRSRRDAPFVPLPDGAGMRVAVRRCLRVRRNAGIPIEDLGVVPDAVHEMTMRDVLEGNVDLIEHAAQLLGGPH
jgi:C-terminal processing protease CtpA/Prc